MFGMGVQTMQFAMTLCFEFAIAVLGGNYHFKSEQRQAGDRNLIHPR